MNKVISKITNIIMFCTMWLFVWDRIKYSEIEKRRYANDDKYKYNITCWEQALFLYNQAQERINLIQSKLASLISVLSILLGLFALTKEIISGYSIIVQAICLILALVGLIYSIGPLTISIVRTVDLDKQNDVNELSDHTKHEFKSAIIDMGCISDFHADCLKTAQSIIVISMVLYLFGFYIN